MTDVAELNEVLEDSLERAVPVTVTVTECQYRCCGGGWQRRVYTPGPIYAVAPQEYTGRVLSISVDSFLLQCDNPIGKMAEVIADFEHLLAATLVD